MPFSPEPSSGRPGYGCWLARVAIHTYRAVGSPIMRWRRMTCLHYPTCSHYGLIAFRKYHFWRALRVTFSRWRDCHPFSGRPYIDYP
ncbi:MAG: membrane protein insertion efficiency factor YidD [Planctomycetes bacterium]|nr:membrane protein insertion efficiency factor YidD [Planctomycetota bacterium]